MPDYSTWGRGWGRGALAALLLPGLGVGEARVRVDPTAPPWSAVVRVQIPGVSRCTGFAVAPLRIVTAAHCLYGRAVGRLLPAGSVHVLAGYEGGSFRRHALAVSYRVADGFAPGANGDPASDVAVLTLAAPVTASVLSLGPTHWGDAAMLGGYSQDFAEALFADRSCHMLGLVRLRSGLAGRRHDCAGTRGTSGAPLLVRGESDPWVAAGVQVRANADDAGGLAVPSETVQHLLEHTP